MFHEIRISEVQAHTFIKSAVFPDPVSPASNTVCPLPSFLLKRLKNPGIRKRKKEKKKNTKGSSITEGKLNYFGSSLAVQKESFKDTNCFLKF